MITINEGYFIDVLTNRLAVSSNLSYSAICKLVQDAVERSKLRTVELQELYNNLQKRVTHFFYKKQDGSTREAWGTLNVALIESLTEEDQDYKKKPSAMRRGCNTFIYFDVEKRAFRSFIQDHFLYFE